MGVSWPTSVFVIAMPVLVVAAGATLPTRDLLQTRTAASRNQVASITTSNQISQAVRATKAGAPAQAATRAATGAGTTAVTTIAGRSGLPVQTGVLMTTTAGRRLMQTNPRSKAGNQIAQATTASKINTAVLTAKTGAAALPATKAATGAGTTAVTTIASRNSGVPVQQAVRMTTTAGKK